MNKIESAYEHIVQELLLDHIKQSLSIDIEKARKAHDSTHELMFMGGNVVGSLKDYSFKTNSLYFIHNWEIFDQATRSNVEALSTYYNSAFVLLRTIIELLIKGVFYDCLAHEKFRNNAKIIEQDKAGKKLKIFLDELIQTSPNISKNFENVSVSILDELDTYLIDKKNVISTRLMLKQIINWGMLDGIENPESLIYGIYQKLSSDVHASPDNTDIGRRLITNRELFTKREIMPEYFVEYLELLHTIMDVCLVALLNILKERIQDSNNAKEFLKKRLHEDDFASLELSRTQQRIRELVEN